MAKQKKKVSPNHNTKGLRSFSSLPPEEKRALQVKGGIESGKVRRAKRLLSDIYADFLANEHDIQLYDKKGKLKVKRLSGESMIDVVLKEILSDPRGPVQSSRVSLLRELREATEGSKVSFTNPDGTPMTMPNGVVVNLIPTTKKNDKK